jgi:hypothetical protein
VRRDVEIAGDLLGRGTIGNLLEDLGLASRQGSDIRALLGELDLLDERPGELRVDHGLPLDRMLCGVDELLRRCVFQEIAGDAGLYRLRDRVPRLIDREEDDPRVGRDLPDLPGRLDSADARHADVHEHDVGGQLLDSVDGLFARAGLADDADFVGQLQGRTEPVPSDGMVIDDESSDRHQSLRLTRAPRPSWRAALE